MISLFYLKQLFLGGIFILAFSALGYQGTANAALFDGAKEEACSAVGAGGRAGCNRRELAQSSSTLSRTARNIINILIVVVGIASVIMLIVSGIRYVTSGGDTNNIAGARRTLIYALIGLIIVAFAQVIVKFIIGKLD